MPLIILIIAVIILIVVSNNRKKAKSEQQTDTKEYRQGWQPKQSATKPQQETYWVPEYKDGAGLAYMYQDIKLVMTNEAVIKDAAFSKKWELTADVINNRIYFYSEGVEIGYIERFVTMMGDWIRRGDPYLALLQHYNDEKGTLLALVFYRKGYKPDAGDDEDDEDDEDLE